MPLLDEATLPRHMLIDGKLVTAERTYPSVNPSTGSVLGHAPDAAVSDALAAVAAARKAFDTTGWSTDVEFRTRCLHQLHAALTKHKEELRELTIADVGAPRGTTHGAQLDEPIEIVEYYARLLPTYSFSSPLGNKEFRGQRHKRWVEREAAGVVAAIIGYNYPNQLALAKLAPALAAGCTVVLKAAPQTPLPTLAIAELIASETDIPAGVVNVISGSAPAVGEALTTSPDVDVVTFTGSTATGRRIMAAASSTIKRVFLELGGKSALVVLDDADTSSLYKTADDRYISLVMLQPGKYWADVCAHVGRPDLVTDPRFDTVEKLMANADEAAEILSAEFAKKTLPEWTTILGTMSGAWAPVQDTQQAAVDPQVAANEYILDAGPLKLVSSPMQFDEKAPVIGPAPEFAAQTEEVLLELGLDWDRIIELKSAGAIT